MSKLWKSLVGGKLKQLLTVSDRKPRCQAVNPTQHKLHGPLPSEDELLLFESSYAGPQTSELMERYSAWVAGTIIRNKNCIVCLRSIRSDPNALLCATCPRVMHQSCLDSRHPHGGHRTHCPLCVKRRWHIIRVITPLQREGQSVDDYHMKRVRRYRRWHGYNCQHIDVWSKLYDDGSLESDRRLLINIGAVKPSIRRPLASSGGHPIDELSTAPDNADAGDGVEEEPPEGMEHNPTPEGAHVASPSPANEHNNYPGEAAESHDRAASRLGSDTKSNRARNVASSPFGDEHEVHVVPSIVESRASTKDDGKHGSERNPANALNAQLDPVPTPNLSHISRKHAGSAASKFVKSAATSSTSSGTALSGHTNEAAAPRTGTLLSNSTRHGLRAASLRSMGAPEHAEQSQDNMHGSVASSRAPSSSRATLNQRHSDNRSTTSEMAASYVGRHASQGNQSG